MKYATLFTPLLLCGMISTIGATQDADGFADLFKAGQAHQKAERYAEARSAYEKALAIPGITPDQSAEALLAVGETQRKEWKWWPAVATYEKVLALDGVSNANKAQAHLGIVAVLDYTGHWEKVKPACLEALKTPGIAPGQKVLMQKSLVKALMNLREFGPARAVMNDLLTRSAAPVPGVQQDIPNTVLQEYAPVALMPAAERATLQVAIAKTLMAERNYPEARTEFAKAQAMPGLTNPLKAEIQLNIGLSYYEAQDYEHAKPELMKVLDMPDAFERPPWDGGRMGYVPAREAKLRLLFRGLLPQEKKTLKVLFIGSSHTLRGDIPEMVTRLAASASADRPQIIAGDYVRMGTNIVTFWNAGDAPDTARGVIASEPWDAVVFETFYNMNAADVMKYATLFSDLIRSRNAVPVIYESPIPKASVFPDAFQKFHDSNVALVKVLKTPVAPSVRAWMRLLGPKPTEEQFGLVYADWIHASPKGAYVTACCIYATLTGASPLGLYRPADIPEAEAKVLQEAAWEAVQETNPGIK